jgi:hypothetical protein|tara:strand:- start:273 stop:506 length:234 start_codon:yes stop_codon:yes gene_type:complete
MMTEFQPIQDKDGWWKDITSGAINCSDQNRYEKYMKIYHADQEEEKKKIALQNDVSELKSEMSEIKTLLLTLVQDKK